MEAYYRKTAPARHPWEEYLEKHSMESEYGPEIITMNKVVFYRFRHFLTWDHVPESLVCNFPIKKSIA